MHVADSQKVLPDFSMKTFGDGSNEHSIRYFAPREALIHTYLVLTNSFFDNV
jgi:hypothetical protein